MPTRNLTQAEAAAQLHISVASLRRYIKDGTLAPPETEPFGKGLRNIYDATWLSRAKIDLENLRRQNGTGRNCGLESGEAY